MNTPLPAPAQELLPPRILAVDDERQIHSSLRLRLGKQFEVVCKATPREALAVLQSQQFDLCVVDIHMPEMDGLTFIEAARKLDPALGYVILSAFDSGENLRRAIPLQVFDFLTKPLPEKAAFEARIPEWVSRTRARRREAALARQSDILFRDLEVARLEKEVELTASAFAREALLQAAGHLTTTQALLLNAHHHLEPDSRRSPHIAMAHRSLTEALKQAESASRIAEDYFSSAYADRETSPAIVDKCIEDAIRLSKKVAKTEERRQAVDYHGLKRDVLLADLSGIDFLLTIIPALTQSLDLASDGATMQVRCHETHRLDQVLNDPQCRDYLWVNRRHALASNPGVVVSVRSNAPALEQELAKAWLNGSPGTPFQRSSRGTIHGIQLAKGLMGVAVKPEVDRFAILFCFRI